MSYEKSIVSVKAFLPDDDEIIKIIEICDLQPLKDDWKDWVDSSGFNLHIKKDHSAYIYQSIPSKQNIVVKDIHFKAPIRGISDNSKLALICFCGEYDACHIWFLGNDDKLKLCTFFKKEWIENRSPLTSGISIPRVIVKNLNIKDHKSINSIKRLSTVILPVRRSWVTKWPPTNIMILNMMFTNVENNGAPWQFPAADRLKWKDE